MSRLIISKKLLEKVISSHEKYDFPTFLLKLRKAVGISREMMAYDLKISAMKIFYIETGHFQNPFPEEFLKKLSTYFEVPHELMVKKIHKYVEDKKAQKKQKVKELNENNNSG